MTLTIIVSVVTNEPVKIQYLMKIINCCKGFYKMHLKSIRKLKEHNM